MIIIHLINRNDEKVHTIVRRTIKGCKIALRGFSADLILVHGLHILDLECREFIETILKPIIVMKRGVIIFLGDERDEPLETILRGRG